MADTLRGRMRVLSGQSLIYGLSGALTKLVGIIIIPILGHIFAPQDFATIDLITAFGSAMGAIILLGSDAAVAFYYFKESDEHGRVTLVSTWMTVQFALNTAAGLALFLFADQLTHVLIGQGYNGWYLRLTGIAFPLGSTINFTLEILRLQMRPTRYVVISGLSVSTGLLMTLLLVVALKGGLLGIYASTLITNTVAFLAAMYSLRHTLAPRISWQRVRDILAYGVPLVPISVATWAIGLSNRFFIRAHGAHVGTGLSDAGLFAMGNRVAQLLLLIVSAFTLAWSPFALSISESRDARRTYAKVLTFYVAGMGWLTFGLGIFAPLILAVATNSQYARAYQVVAPLACAYAIYGAYPIVAMGTALSKKTIHLSWTTIAGGLVAVLLNAVLVPLPYLSIAGGAIATLCGNLVLVGLVLMVSQRLYPVPFETRKVTACLVILASAVVLGQLARPLLPPTSPAGITLRLLAFLLYPLALVQAGVIERYEVRVLTGALRSRFNRRRSGETQ